MKIKMPQKSKIKVHWKVNHFDYSKDNLRTIVEKFSSKYGLPKTSIEVIPEFIDNNGKSSFTSDITNNIQDPQFQFDLMKEYINVNGIDNCDLDLLKSIDAEVNAKIDFDEYKSHNKYSLNWVKWDNFLSYGEDNYFDFTTLRNLVLLNGDPANQSGKTTFAIDLIHFLFFGKTDKSATLDKIFNRHLPEAKTVVVEGSLTINGEIFIIKRELSRTSLEKRNSKSRTSQKVSYYKVIGDVRSELCEIEQYQGADVSETNKIIKDAIGSEADFDMIICATNSNLDELIDKKDAERGRLLSRWIGLLPIEKKEEIAKEIYNTTRRNRLLSNVYNTEQLSQDIITNSKNVESCEYEIKKYEEENVVLDKILADEEEKRVKLIESKKRIDDDVLKLDINTLEYSISEITRNGQIKKEALLDCERKIDELKDVEFSHQEYDVLVSKVSEINGEMVKYREKYKQCERIINEIKNSEFCPTCGRRYEGVDNTDRLNTLEQSKSEMLKQYGLLKTELENVNLSIENMRVLREKYDMKAKYCAEKSALEFNIERLRNEFKEKYALKQSYLANKEAIIENNNIDIEIKNVEVNIVSKRRTREYNLQLIEKNKSSISELLRKNTSNEEIIAQLAKEAHVERHWSLYKDMVGKDGIVRLVLRKTLPIINAQIANLLYDVCDFSVEIGMTDKNDIIFYIVRDGIKADLISGSGFERTAAALALRTVLGNISTLPKINGLILDEIWGRVAKENYDNMKNLLNKMLSNYDYIIMISHLDEIKEYCDNIITVSKTNNVSKINIVK